MLRTFSKVLALSALAGAVASAHALVIDDFTIGQTAAQVANPDPGPGTAINQTNATQACGATSSIIGGCRDLFVIMRDSPAGADGERTRLSVNTSNNTVVFSNDSSITGTGIIRWDGTNANWGGIGADPAATIANAIASVDVSGTGGFAPIDLLANGNAFNFNVATSDLAGWTFSIWAYSADGGISRFESVVNPLLIGVPIPFAALTQVGALAADFSAITALQAVINWQSGAASNSPLADLDLSIGRVSVVPTPATLALVGLALFAAGVATRRRAA